MACDKPTNFRLKLRIPAFVQGRPLPGDLYRYLDAEPGNIRLTVDGEAARFTIENGYINLEREWHAQTRIELNLSLRTRRVVANAKVDDLRGMVALERGPIVYALEQADNAADVLRAGINDATTIDSQHEPDLLGGVTTLTGQAVDGGGKDASFKAVPYYAWAHRGENAMTVWLRREG